MLRGGLGPWSQAVVSEGARLWGRGRSEFANHFPVGKNQSRLLGRGCDEALFSEKKGFSVKRGEAIQ